MTIPQEQMITRLTELCHQDERLVAAMLYGSFIWGEADQYSDIDCMLYFAGDRLKEIKTKEWLNQIRPVDLFYNNKFGNSVAIFDNLVRGEFHSGKSGDMASLASHRGRVTFPSLDSVILVDKSGQLAGHVRPLIGRPPRQKHTPGSSILDR